MNTTQNLSYIFIKPVDKSVEIIDDKRDFKKSLMQWLIENNVRSDEENVWRYKRQAFHVLLKNTSQDMRLNEKTKLKLRRIGVRSDIIFSNCAFLPGQGKIIPQFELSTSDKKQLNIDESTICKRVQDLFANQFARLNYTFLFSENGSEFGLTYKWDSRKAYTAKFQHHKLQSIDQFDLICGSSISLNGVIANDNKPKRISTRLVTAKSQWMNESFETFLERKGIYGVPQKLIESVYSLIALYGPDHLRLTAKKRGITGSRSILFYGPPGNGKTTYAELIAEYLQIKNFIRKSGSELISSIVGGTEKAIRELFQKAQSDWEELGNEAPLTIIFIDEIDAVVPSRDTTNLQSYMVPQVTQFLTSLESAINKTGNIIFIAATNKRNGMDSAFLRSGRMNVHIEVGNPNLEMREKLIQHFLKPLVDLDVVDRIDTRKLAEITDGFSAADIKGLIDKANNFHFARNTALLMQKKITQEQFESSAGDKITFTDLAKLIIGDANAQILAKL